MEAIENLPEEEREVFNLVRIQGLSQPERRIFSVFRQKQCSARLNRGLLSEKPGDLSPLPPGPV